MIYFCELRCVILSKIINLKLVLSKVEVSK